MSGGLDSLQTDMLPLTQQNSKSLAMQKNKQHQNAVFTLLTLESEHTELI